MTMKAAKASDVAYSTGTPNTLMKPPRPVAKAATGAPLDPTATDKRARSPSRNSQSIEPPPTGSMSASFSICRAVPTDPNSACQPEMATQAMVTNRRGHSGMIPDGPICGFQPWKAGMTNCATSGLSQVARAAPASPSTMAVALTQKATYTTGWAIRQMGSTDPA